MRARATRRETARSNSVHERALSTALGGLRPLVRARRRLRGPLRPSWDEELETFAACLHTFSRFAAYMPVEVQREALESLGGVGEEPLGVRVEPAEIGGVPGVRIRPPGCGERSAILYLHGGGYVLGSTLSHRRLLERIARAAGVSVWAIDYRLAPEHRFPAQLEDALSAYRWLLERGVAPERLAVAGDSAGGGLTLSTLIAARDGGLPLPAAAACLSPWVDLEPRGASIARNARYDYVNRTILRVCARRFAPEKERRNPLAAPIRADLRGLPPLLVQAGGAEVLLDDAVAITRAARDAGVDARLDVWPDMIHVFQIFGFARQAKEATEQFGAFLRERVAGS